MKPKKTNADKIETLRFVADECGARFMADYVGRFMDGQKCCAIATSDPHAIAMRLWAMGFDFPSRDKGEQETVFFWPMIR